MFNKKHFKRFTAIVLMAVMVFLMVPPCEAHALDKALFAREYKAYLARLGKAESDKGAERMVDCAKAMVGKTGKDVDSGGAWCAAFVSCCAQTVQESAAVPYNVNVKGIYNAIKKAGGIPLVSVNSAKPGDIIIYRTCGYNYGHVEIVTKSVFNGRITSIGGNTGNDNHRKATVKEHSWSTSSVTAVIRPAYVHKAPAAPKTYLDKCTKAAVTSIILTADTRDYLMTMPCASSTSKESQAIRRMKTGETFKATAIYKNTAGNYWYLVKADSDGKTGYIYAGSAHYSGISSPAPISGNVSLGMQPKKGKGCDLLGTISSTLTIKTISGVLVGSDNKKQTATVSVGKKSFEIKPSAINKNLKFGRLPKGKGYVQLFVTLQAPYVDRNTLQTKEVTVALAKVWFTVK
ncbi:MAG: CHAP domain-containing protein [Clostridiales bacterium]|nr:CHAP domain-containing protein [Clostridiales bacterium]